MTSQEANEVIEPKTVQWLTKDDILAADDLKTEEVYVAEWGGTILMKTMMGHERDKFESGILATRKKGKPIDVQGVKVRMIILCAVDTDGKPIFDMRDLQMLNHKSSKAIDQLFQVAQRMNGFDDDEIEELAGNSDAAQSGDSG